MSSAPPPEDPDGSADATEGEQRPLDFEAEFERIVAGWTPEHRSPGEPAETPDEPPSSSVESPSSVEPVESPPDPPAGNLRDLFQRTWGEDPPSGPELEPADPDEHYVPPPPPPLPRPEPARLLAWTGLLLAPLVGLLLLLLGSLPSFASFLLFCWFVGGFGYLVATMKDRGHDGWDDGAQV